MELHLVYDKKKDKLTLFKERLPALQALSILVSKGDPKGTPKELIKFAYHGLEEELRTAVNDYQEERGSSATAWYKVMSVHLPDIDDLNSELSKLEDEVVEREEEVSRLSEMLDGFENAYGANIRVAQFLEEKRDEFLLNNAENSDEAKVFDQVIFLLNNLPE